VVSGQASFNQQGNVFSITNTPNTIINWQSFSIGAGETTRFIQQSASSSVLNRILGQEPQQDPGRLAIEWTGVFDQPERHRVSGTTRASTWAAWSRPA